MLAPWVRCNHAEKAVATRVIDEPPTERCVGGTALLKLPLLPMPKTTAIHTPVHQGHAQDAPTAYAARANGRTSRVIPVDETPCHTVPSADAKTLAGSTGARAQIKRGLSENVSSLRLRDAIWRRTLTMANRFRVIRTIDVAASCCAERTYKSALTAAQRAVRGMVKAKLIARYKTDRFQTVYGLTARGAASLQDMGIDASSSVRRVSDMRNPEHRLWLQFLVIACEVRGLRAETESEVLRSLNKGATAGQPMVQGLLSVAWTRGGKTVRQSLRPDAIAYEADGVTWFEADISKRGAGREAALAALAVGIGRTLPGGEVLRRVVVFCKTDRIRLRALAVLREVGAEQNSKVLVGDRVHVRECEEGVFEVWRAQEEKLGDGRSRVVDRRLGHVVIQALPTWLPKLRVEDAGEPVLGWFSDGLLPYRRPASLPAWPACASPLLVPGPGRTSSAASMTLTDRTRAE